MTKFMQEKSFVVFLEYVLCLCKVIINSLSVIAVAICRINKWTQMEAQA